jgi:hypothetical protein
VMILHWATPVTVNGTPWAVSTCSHTGVIVITWTEEKETKKNVNLDCFVQFESCTKDTKTRTGRSLCKWDISSFFQKYKFSPLYSQRLFQENTLKLQPTTPVTISNSTINWLLHRSKKPFHRWKTSDK